MSSQEVITDNPAEYAKDERLVVNPFDAPHWYAVHTSSQREKRVATYLLQSGVEHFLPVYQNVRRWSDRVVTIESPLFAGYLFVRISLREKLRVLKAPGVAGLVGTAGQPSPIPESDIEKVRSGMVKGAMPHPYLTVGRRVEIISGPLGGTTGILLRKKNNLRVVVNVDSIARAMAIEVSEADVQPVMEFAARSGQ